MVDRTDSLPDDYLALVRQLWWLNRVHNGDDMEAAVRILKSFCDTRFTGETRIHTYSPGQVFNHWIVPPRWRLRAFRLTGPDGGVIATEADHPLVVCPFSCAVDTDLDLEELRNHIVTPRELPDAYTFFFRRMYRHWEKGWTIAIPSKVVDTLLPGRYRVCIDAEFVDAPMVVLEHVLNGRSDKTIFIAAHLDHPGQVNDSLSGCICALQTMEALQARYAQTEYTYRILLGPEIVGTAVYLKANEHLIDRAFFARKRSRG